MSERECTDWHFTKEDLKRTPSVLCGWTVEREELERAKACSLIHSASRKLHLPQLTAISACVYLHRFYMRHTLKDYHHYNIAATCLFFACKSEESLRKLDSFIPVIVYYTSKGNRRAQPGTAEYEKWRAVILRTEVVLLQALCFDMVIDHPHVTLAELFDKLKLSCTLSQMAWNFIGDCIRLPLCLVYSPKSIACASVALAVKVSAAEDLKGSLKDDSWMEKVGADHAMVAEIVQWVLEFYVREAQSRTNRGGCGNANGKTANGTGAASHKSISSSPVSTTSPAPYNNSSNYNAQQLPSSSAAVAPK